MFSKKQKPLDERILQLHNEIIAHQRAITEIRKQIAEFQKDCRHDDFYSVDRVDGTGWIICKTCTAELSRLY